MKKLIYTLTLLIMFLLAGCSFLKQEPDVLQKAKERGYFVVGVIYDTKPFVFKNTKNEPDGFDIDIAKRISKNILGTDKNIKYVEAQVYNSLSMVASGEVDFLVSAMTITPQRELTVSFSEPYYVSGQSLLVRNDSKIRNIRDLNNKLVLVNLNSTGEQTPKKFAPAARVMGFKTMNIMLNKFKQGYGDAIITDAALLTDVINENPEFKILTTKYTKEPYCVVLQNTQEAKSLQNAINHVLLEMKNDGSISKLKEKWDV